MTNHRLEIHTKEGGFSADVKLDGVDIGDKIRGINLTLEAASFPVATIDFMPKGVDVVADCLVEALQEENDEMA